MPFLIPSEDRLTTDQNCCECDSASCRQHGIEFGLRAIFRRRHRWHAKRGSLLDMALMDSNEDIPE